MDGTIETAYSDLVRLSKLRPHAPCTKARKRAAFHSAATHSRSGLLKACADAAEEEAARSKQSKPVLARDVRLARALRLLKSRIYAPYVGHMQQIPRMVNVVTLATVENMSSDSTAATIDLVQVASRCSGAYFAPKRFASVQLAYRLADNSRARVLVFHTGRIVGTGSTGPASARLAIMLALEQMRREADIQLHVKDFKVINSVGAASLNATINCDAFADAHSSEVHFDRSNFVGLAWRPSGCCVCVELYSTGRANIPGAKRERALIDSFANLMPEIFKYSSRSSGGAGGDVQSRATPSGD